MRQAREAGRALAGAVLVLMAGAAGAQPAGTTFRDCPECPVMVVVPSGSFLMGSVESEEERPVHRVTIGYPFAVGVYEVTFGEWDACVSEGGCRSFFGLGDEGWGRGRRPVISISIWEFAQDYVRWLSGKTGEAYRLLSESEWEYAARAGTTTRYWWGDEVGWNRANCDGCGSRWDGRQTAPVGSFSPNPFGLYDVHGNVSEWVEDCWNESYHGAPADGSAWEEEESWIETRNGRCHRVLRGGSWYFRPGGLRSASRTSGWSVNPANVGFRVARTLKP